MYDLNNHEKKYDLSVYLLIIAVYVILHILKIGCPIKFLTGISCAGCGMTRAWLSVLKLDFAQACYFHPLFWVVPIGIFVYLFRKHIPVKGVKFLTSIAVGLFITVYIIRMMDPENTVVTINFYESASWRILERVREFFYG